jgi:hypothetical protein
MESLNTTNSSTETDLDLMKSKVQDVLNEITVSNEPDAVVAGLDILNKLAQNMLKNP